ncbi:uncharacterized protein METZ01_LOCUS374774, partial [marine metagenome]
RPTDEASSVVAHQGAVLVTRSSG